MLQIKNLSITHKKDLRPLLEHFTFSLNSGDKAVIISEEGNGKSTLLKLIYDSRLVDSYWNTQEISLPRVHSWDIFLRNSSGIQRADHIYLLHVHSCFFRQEPGRTGRYRRPASASQGYFLLRPAVRHTFGRRKSKAADRRPADVPAGYLSAG